MQMGDKSQIWVRIEYVHDDQLFIKKSLFMVLIVYFGILHISRIAIAWSNHQFKSNPAFLKTNINLVKIQKSKKKCLIDECYALRESWKCP